MAEEDFRIEQHPVVRAISPAITIPTTGVTEITVTMKVNMTVKAIVYRAGDTSTDITRTLSIRDSYGAEWFSKASLADNTATPLNGLKSTQDFAPFPINGTITLGVTPSAASERTAEVSDYVDLIGT